MSLFVLSDTHLSLSSEKPMDVFGGRWQGHAEKIKKNWEALVTEEDTVVIPGDLSWAMNLEEAKKDLLFLASLPGRKVLSRGNHDYFWISLSKMQRLFEENGYDNISFLQNNALLEQGFVLVGSRGWFVDPADTPRDADFEKVSAREAIRLRMSLEAGKALCREGEEMIAFFHFPPLFADFENRTTIDMLHEYGVRRVYYGHVHGAYSIPPVREYEGMEFHIASADYLNFIPKLIK